MTRLAALWLSVRPKQWIKNGLVFAPAAFAGRLSDPRLLVATALAAVCFCLASSAAYVFNDVLDRRIDRFHPVKRHRPIASGRLSGSDVWWLACGLLGAAVALGLFLDVRLGLLLIAYVALTAVYSILLKRIVILDVMVLAMGFVLRILAGTIVSGIIPSAWMQLTVFFLALFLSLAKRRQELLSLHRGALAHRKVLGEYTREYLDQLTSLTGTIAVITYALYTISPDVTHRTGPMGLILTIPPALYGVFRYLFLMHVRRGALDPVETLLSDRPLQLSVAVWIGCLALSLYR